MIIYHLVTVTHSTVSDRQFLQFVLQFLHDQCVLYHLMVLKLYECPYQSAQQRFQAITSRKIGVITLQNKGNKNQCISQGTGYKSSLRLVMNLLLCYLSQFLTPAVKLLEERTFWRPILTNPLKVVLALKFVLEMCHSIFLPSLNYCFC